jgi:hypothetical protein
MAILIEGVSGVGALMSILSLALSAALSVAFPKAAIRVFFCLKLGKFLKSDSIPDGLKKN